MSLWPRPETVAAAFRGIAREVLTVTEGESTISVVGLSSGLPHVKLILTRLPSGSALALCEHCGAQEGIPPSPSSQGLNGAAEPLFVAGTRAHAVFALTWLHRFAHAHEHAGEAGGFYTDEGDGA